MPLLPVDMGSRASSVEVQLTPAPTDSPQVLWHCEAEAATVLTHERIFEAASHCSQCNTRNTAFFNLRRRVSHEYSNGGGQGS